jgi:hypothetical protein
VLRLLILSAITIGSNLLTMIKHKPSKTVRQMLGLSLPGWENAMIASLVVAALAATAVGISTWVVVQLQRQELATSKEEFEHLRATNLALEVQIQPRRLNGNDFSKLLEVLTKMPPLPIAIVSRLFDVEGSDFADDIFRVFEKAKWLPVRQRDWTMSNKGVALAALEGTVIPENISVPILEILKGIHINATTVTIQEKNKNTTSASFQPQALYLLIGAKP